MEASEKLLADFLALQPTVLESTDYISYNYM